MSVIPNSAPRVHTLPGRLTSVRALLVLGLVGLFPGAMASPGRAPLPRKGHPPALTSEQAWERLPAAERGAGQPLPVWARTLAPTLPRTTAAMLELDFLHRTHPALPARLRGQLRWVAAHTVGCECGEAYAAADLRAAGVDEAGILSLAGDLGGLPEPEKAALSFARKLTRDGSSVTDAEVARLIDSYGETQVVAMVLLLAHANFQDRLLLALDLAADDGEALGPLDVCFAKLPPGGARTAAPRDGPRLIPAPLPVTNLAAATPFVADPEWASLTTGDLDREIAKQQARRPRIRLPENGHAEIRWGLVCRAYQPELAGAWAECTRAFGEEADEDPVFEESVFWVITRTVRCFY